MSVQAFVLLPSPLHDESRDEPRNSKGVTPKRFLNDAQKALAEEKPQAAQISFSVASPVTSMYFAACMRALTMYVCGV